MTLCVYIYIYVHTPHSYQSQTAVDPAPDRAGAVLHDILGEGTRLVREDLGYSFLCFVSSVLVFDSDIGTLTIKFGFCDFDTRFILPRISKE